MTNRKFRLVRNRHVFLAIMLVMATLLALACSNGRSILVSRENLFTLDYGNGYKEIDLFRQTDTLLVKKTRISMKDGIIAIANGPGAKVLRLSSFGDMLNVIETPIAGSSPASDSGVGEILPHQSAAEAENSFAGRVSAYEFNSVGEIAINSNQDIYVEDRLGPEKAVVDEKTKTILEYSVLIFDKEGHFLGRLGQEGLGGTPFPSISGIYITSSDECIIAARQKNEWHAFWFDSQNKLVSSLKLQKPSLPASRIGHADEIVVDRIIPDNDGKELLIKIDYYSTSLEQQGNAATISMLGSWIYSIDKKTGSFSNPVKVPTIEETQYRSGGTAIRYTMVPEFLGKAGRSFYFSSADESGQTLIMTLDPSSGRYLEYKLDIQKDEIWFNTFYLSREGLLCALLAGKDNARVVWWRLEKLVNPIGVSAR